MAVKAQVVVLPPGEQTLHLQSVQLPEPGPWEVVMEQRAFGICHSQLDLIDNPSTIERPW